MKILSAQQAYWKQRATIRWITKGETNSKFLKVKATIKFRHNHIASLKDEFGIVHSGHHAKADILCRAFKQRLGTSTPIFNLLNLEDLVDKFDDLHWLEAPFTKSEIDAVVKIFLQIKPLGLMVSTPIL